jgi:hypothetical protein
LTGKGECEINSGMLGMERKKEWKKGEKRKERGRGR